MRHRNCILPPFDAGHRPFFTQFADASQVARPWCERARIRGVREHGPAPRQRL